MTFTITMITFCLTFQYKIVLKVFKISGHLSKKSDNGLWPGGNENTEQWGSEGTLRVREWALRG